MVVQVGADEDGQVEVGQVMHIERQAIQISRSGAIYQEVHGLDSSIMAGVLNDAPLDVKRVHRNVAVGTNRRTIEASALQHYVARVGRVGNEEVGYPLQRVLHSAEARWLQ